MKTGEQEQEGQPPPARRPAGALKQAFRALSSPRLAITLLIAVLACCVVGVTVLAGPQAGELIFWTLWFNGLLVLLALSSGLTFVARIWGRKLTLVSAGMIVFHACFLAMLLGVVYNALFHFNGVLRLTEGETLPNSDPASYDSVEVGRFFDFARLGGETTLIKMHRGYKVGGLDKRAAYEIAVGEPADKKTDIIYMTQNLDHGGARYLVAKEGYSIGVVLHDKQGHELNATMVPLQSFPKGKDAYTYVTGTAQEPSAFMFPPLPAPTLLVLQVGYVPDAKQDRAGQVEFQTWSAANPAAAHAGVMGADTKGPAGVVAVGGRFDAGDYLLEAREVRYWVGMAVRYDPGLMVILSSLWAGLGGMTMTFVGRILQDSKRGKREAVGQQSDTKSPKENS